MYVSLWCLLSDPHITTHQSSLGIRLRICNRITPAYLITPYESERWFLNEDWSYLSMSVIVPPADKFASWSWPGLPNHAKSCYCQMSNGTSRWTPRALHIQHTKACSGFLHHWIATYEVRCPVSAPDWFFFLYPTFQSVNDDTDDTKLRIWSPWPGLSKIKSRIAGARLRTGRITQLHVHL